MRAIRASIVCERVRAQVSLELDGELSQLERRMLASHLERCPQCHAFAADVRAFTEDLRNAPLETLDQPVVVRRLRRATTARLQIGAAAVLAFAALGLGSQLASSEPQGPSLSRFEGAPNLSPRTSVLEREQAILQVVRPGTPLPVPGSVL